MKTTLDINDALHARAKALAAQLRMPLTRLVEVAIEEKLRQPGRPGTPAKRFRVRAFDLGMKAGYRGMNFNHLASELEDEAILQKMQRSRGPRGST